jgi:UDP-N-acetylglucosamine 2-epimerase (non-hydrolysing)
MKNLIVVVGARPNFMKVALLLPKMEKIANVKLVHTGQHSLPSMSDAFIKEFGMKVDTYLEAKSEFGDIHRKFCHFCDTTPADAVMVVGDVTSTLACALGAKYAGIRVIHVEAGLRSGDVLMPEEINRMAVDSISDVLIATDEYSYATCAHLPHAHKNFMCGNTMIDLLIHYERELTKITEEYLLVTIHRRENILKREKLEHVIRLLDGIAKERLIIWPVHPHTRLKICSYGLDFIFNRQNVKIVEPMGYIDFMSHVKHAKAVLTDSGGVQVEANYLGVPCITLRSSTEHKSTLFGTNRLAGLKIKYVQEYVYEALNNKNSFCAYRSVLDDGRATERIVEGLSQWL